MDDLDEEILNEFYINPYITLQKIANKLNKPTSTIHYRYKKLIKEGYLTKQVKINLKKLGYDKHYLIFIKGKNYKENFEKALETLGISNIFKLIDVWDYILELYVKDNSELDSTVQSIKKLFEPTDIKLVIIND
jgi:DNA-binding Lrp family transcriptional regulator